MPDDEGMLGHLEDAAIDFGHAAVHTAEGVGDGFAAVGQTAAMMGDAFLDDTEGVEAHHQARDQDKQDSVDEFSQAGHDIFGGGGPAEAPTIDVGTTEEFYTQPDQQVEYEQMSE